MGLIKFTKLMMRSPSPILHRSTARSNNADISTTSNQKPHKPNPHNPQATKKNLKMPPQLPQPSSQPTPNTTTTEEPPSPLALTTRRTESYTTMSRNLSWGLVIACPILIAMPPRKLDVYTLLLGSTTALSANHLRTLYWSPGGVGSGNSAADGEKKTGWLRGMFENRTEMPTERARQVQALMRERLERERVEREREMGDGEGEMGVADRIRSFVEEAFEERGMGGEGKEKGVSEAVRREVDGLKMRKKEGEWSEDWKEREKAAEKLAENATDEKEEKKKGWLW
ncbi:hypothetical protein EJ05DRAFT_509975 [Pseudovirgaria hyperparasitica]|uniref:Uncharacterized protein n=1 Tax=Pseudovirgaria hyperparasitica TaxID=470096 RepID=A0A6A6WDC7_9PEZI|nr:uncharacterized protein EJ05DRAFT_509975 [Pseudovirgaria hyperparasitica]KAF2759111.1 hypothetical protein EJ05DRAFT_509975 [Pseudovirgaria hyperparasitica]